MTNPRPFHAAIRVEKEGYKQVTKLFLHKSPASHTIVIIMVLAEGSGDEK